MRGIAALSPIYHTMHMLPHFEWPPCDRRGYARTRCSGLSVSIATMYAYDHKWVYWIV